MPSPAARNEWPAPRRRSRDRNPSTGRTDISGVHSPVRLLTARHRRITLGRRIAFRVEAVDDPVFDRRLILPDTAAGGWIVLTYRTDPAALPRRPILRLVRPFDVQDFVLPGVAQARAHWLGLLPQGTVEIRLAADAGFVLERVGRRSHAGLLGQCLVRRPLKVFSALYERLRGDERRYRDTLRGACAVTPRADFADWAAERRAEDDRGGERPADLTAPVERRGKAAPSIRVLVVAEGDATTAIAETVASLRGQTHRAWHALIVSAGAAPASFGTDPRIAHVPWPEDGTWEALAAGDAVCLLRAGDRLTPDALSLLACGLAWADLAYGDEIAADGTPRLKPDWSPDLALASGYQGRPCLASNALLARLPNGVVGPAAEVALSLELALASAADRVVHVPRVLARTVGTPPDAAARAAVLARHRERLGLRFDPVMVIRDHGADLEPCPIRLDRITPLSPCVVALSGDEPASTSSERALSRFRKSAPRFSDKNLRHNKTLSGRSVGLPTQVCLAWPLPRPAPLASIVIPSRDRLDLIARICRGILQETDYPAIELVVVDNASTDSGVLAYYASLRRDPRVRIVPFREAFNFSAMVNTGVAASRGGVVVLVNNDVAVLRPGWLDAMVRQACRPEVGAVGAKLLYADGTLQHAGVVVGLGGRAGHILRRRPADTPGHLGQMRVAHEVSAVTAACLAVERAKYDAVGGFDAASFPIDFNDVDFCLRLGAAGYKTVWTPAATLAHRESDSRGPSVGPARLRFDAEAARFSERWRDVIRHDPFYHPALSLTTFGEDLE